MIVGEIETTKPNESTYQFKLEVRDNAHKIKVNIIDELFLEIEVVNRRRDIHEFKLAPLPIDCSRTVESAQRIDNFVVVEFKVDPNTDTDSSVGSNTVTEPAIAPTTGTDPGVARTRTEIIRNAHLDFVKKGEESIWDWIGTI